MTILYSIRYPGSVKNTSPPQYTVGKKHNAVNDHAVHEAAKAGILRVGKEYTETNLADLLTKILGGNDATSYFQFFYIQYNFSKGIHKSLVL